MVKKAVYFDNWLETQMKNKEFNAEYKTEELRNPVETQVHIVRKKGHKEELIKDMKAINEFKNDKNKIMNDEKSVKKRLGL